MEVGELGKARHGHMSDADRLLDCLADARQRALMYADSALECTNNGMREFYLALHGEETHYHEILFSFVHTRGFYPVQMAPAERMSELHQRYRSIHDEMQLQEAPSFRRYQTADPKMPPAHLQYPEDYTRQEH